MCINANCKNAFVLFETFSNFRVVIVSSRFLYCKHLRFKRYIKLIEINIFTRFYRFYRSIYSIYLY